VKLTPEQAQALTRLKSSPEGQVLLNMLGVQAENLTRTLIMSDTASTDLVRGEVRAYTRIFDAFQKAPDVLEQYENAVNEAVRVPLEQHEFDALVHFTYNVGGPNLRRSRLLRLINQGHKGEAGRSGFHGWLRPPELRGRRDAESAMFLHGDYGTSAIPVYRTDGNKRLRGRLTAMSRGHVMSLLADPFTRPQRASMLPVVPREVQEAAEDAAKPLRVSKTAWATVSAMGLSAWQAFQAADPMVQAVSLAAIVLLVVVFFERFRKSRLGKAAVARLGL